MTTIILFAPLIGALICGFGWRLIGEKRGAGHHHGPACSWRPSCRWIIFLTFDGETQQIVLMRWIDAASFGAEWAIRLDRLTAIMLVVVNTVSALVHLYSLRLHGA